MQEVTNLYDMFYTRYLLYKRAYHHKTVNVIELMYVAVFIVSYNAFIINTQDLWSIFESRWSSSFTRVNTSVPWNEIFILIAN